MDWPDDQIEIWFRPVVAAGAKVDALRNATIGTDMNFRQIVDPHIFANPESFDIDRYYEPRNEHRQHGAFAAFGIGDHSCIGAGIAEIQLAVIFATILRDYRWQCSAHPAIVPALTPAPNDEFSITLLTR